MNEADLIYQLSIVLDRIWSMQQWWASVSIGVLVMAHLASSRLNLFLIILSLALYSLYTFFMYSMLLENVGLLSALARDLQALIDSGVANSHVAKEQADIMNDGSGLFVATYAGTYVSVMAYLLYSYMRARRDGDMFV